MKDVDKIQALVDCVAGLMQYCYEKDVAVQGGVLAPPMITAQDLLLEIGIAASGQK